MQSAKSIALQHRPVEELLGQVAGNAWPQNAVQPPCPSLHVLTSTSSLPPGACILTAVSLCAPPPPALPRPATPTGAGMGQQLAAAGRRRLPASGATPNSISRAPAVAFPFQTCGPVSGCTHPTWAAGLWRRHGLHSSSCPRLPWTAPPSDPALGLGLCPACRYRCTGPWADLCAELPVGDALGFSRTRCKEEMCAEEIKEPFGAAGAALGSLAGNCCS